VLLSLAAVLVILGGLIGYSLIVSPESGLNLAASGIVEAIAISIVSLLLLNIYANLGDLPETIAVVAGGLSIRYSSGTRLEARWVPSRKSIRLVDSHLLETKYSSRRLLIGHRAAIPITEDAQVAILDSARANGAIMTEGPTGLLWEQKVREFVLGVDLT